MEREAPDERKADGEESRDDLRLAYMQRELAAQRQHMQLQLQQQQQQFELLMKRVMKPEPSRPEPTAPSLAAYETYERVSIRDTGAHIKTIKHATSDEALNSWSGFKSALKSLNLDSIARDGPLAHAPDDHIRGSRADRALSTVLQSYIEGDETVASSVRNTFGEGGSSFEKLNHVYTAFIKPMEVDEADAELKVKAFDWSQLEGMDGRKARALFDSFIALVAKLPSAVQGDDKYWTKAILRKLPRKVLDAVGREQQIAASEGSPIVFNSVRTLAYTVGKAVDGEQTFRENERAARLVHQAEDAESGRSISSVNPPPQPQPKPPPHVPPAAPPQPSQQRQQTFRKCSACGQEDHPVWECPTLTPCPECRSKTCPKGSDEKNECDIHGTPSAARIARLTSNNMTRINERRLDAGKPVLVKAPTVSSITSRIDTSRDEYTKEIMAHLDEFAPPPAINSIGSAADATNSHEGEVMRAMKMLESLPKMN